MGGLHDGDFCEDEAAAPDGLNCHLYVAQRVVVGALLSLHSGRALSSGFFLPPPPHLLILVCRVCPPSRIVARAIMASLCLVYA